LRAQRPWCIGFARGVAKAALFITENPAAGAYIFLTMYPPPRPKRVEAQSDPVASPPPSPAERIEAQTDAILGRLRRRMPLYRSYDRAVIKAGYIAPAEWQAEVKYAPEEAKIPDSSIFFTDALIDEINQFDADAIRRQARDFPLPFPKA
jgi:NitT/TauT family transport system substrate-binding protein